MSGVKKLKRLPCQVCGRRLTLRRDGLVKRHGPGGCCRGVGYRHDQWPLGQHLQHHSGAVWEVTERRGIYPCAYALHCIETRRANPDAGDWVGRVMVAAGEYMHRHGWTPVDDDCMCGHGFDRHDHRRHGSCRDCDEPLECSTYEPDLVAPAPTESKGSK